jgi:thiamine-phosphate diphosphorylase
MTALGCPSIHLVTDRRRLSPRAATDRERLTALRALIADAIAAGVDVVQLRERDLDARALGDLTHGAMAWARGTATAVVINDRADVAAVCGAHGVHLRADSAVTARVRARGPAEWLVGRSVHGVAEVTRHQDADYLVLGTLFDTVSKPGVAAGGRPVIEDAVRSSRVPIIAIGGITPERARHCAAAGAAGVAAIGLFLPAGVEPGALGVAVAVRELREAFDQGRSGHVQ